MDLMTVGLVWECLQAEWSVCAAWQTPATVACPSDPTYSSLGACGVQELVATVITLVWTPDGLWLHSGFEVISSPITVVTDLNICIMKLLFVHLS